VGRKGISQTSNSGMVLVKECVARSQTLITLSRPTLYTLADAIITKQTYTRWSR
jgi:hypothetical protein